MAALWLLDLPWERTAQARPGLSWWRSLDGALGRAYFVSAAAPGPGWVGLACVQELLGASFGAQPAFHYTVETDVAPEHEAELDAWYAQEHLPGLARVPGAIRAARYRRQSGSPRYLACYDLTDPATLERPEWLAVRHTEWSARVRPTFRNPRRTMFRRA